MASTENTFDSALVETHWLQAHLQDPNLRILDCSVVMQQLDDDSYGFVSGRGEWEKGHIPGSIFVDVRTELSDTEHALGMMMPEPEALAATMMKYGVGDDTQVVLYDRGNHAWATRVWWMLRVCGFDNAAVLNGGWNKWQADGLAASTEQSTYPAAEKFSLNCRPQLMASKERVLESLEIEGITLIHSLPPATYTGEVAPYGRAGRIAGSKNVFCDTLLDADSGCYIDLDSLRLKFSDSGALHADTVITYCGGGIAASSNAFILALLGLENVELYDGSLSEWTLNPDLPMETG